MLSVVKTWRRRQNDVEVSMATVQQFLETLFPDLRGGFIEIRAIHPADQEPQSRVYPSIEALCAEQTGIDALAKHFHVYFGVCPRSREAGGKDAVKLVWCLWIDLDAKSFPGGKEEALKRLREFPLSPTVIVDSGHGFHAYWRIKEPEEIVGAEDVVRLEAHLKALASALGGDLQAAELARILRLPGTNNLKDTLAPLPVTLIECDPVRQYNLSDFQTFLDIPASTPSTPKNPIGWIAEALSVLTEGNRNATFARIAGRLRWDGLEATDILALLTPLAEKSGFPLAELRGEVEGLCRRYPTGKSSPSSPNNRGATETESKPLQALPLAVFLESGGQTVEWCVERILPKEGAGILAGPAGYGKSWMLLDLAIECARGGKWLGQFPTLTSRVLYLDEESSPGLLRKRLRKLLGGKKLPQGGLDVHFCVGQGFSLSKPDSVEHLRILLGSLRPGLVIVDSLIRVHRAEENSASEMARVFEVVKNLIREFGCAFLFADHQRKPGHFWASQDLLLRGSSEKAAFVDTLLSIQKKEESLIVEHSKSRCDEAVPAFVVKIEDREAGTTTVAYAGEAEALKQQARQEMAREFLATALRGGDWITRKELIEQAKEAEVSEKAVAAAREALEAEGRLERENRKPEGGRGGKAAFYRWKPISSPSQGQETETETEMEGSEDDNPEAT